MDVRTSVARRLRALCASASLAVARRIRSRADAGGFSRAICGAVAIVAGVAGAAIALSGQTAPGIESRVDAVFAKWTGTTPGCAVGVAANGKPSLAKGYGMADLEHDVRITPESIFEAGSVSKQFTAASVLLLARAGKLSLDDPVRKYTPELPDYESLAPPKGPGGGSGRVALTIRHMLTHTSG